MHSSDHQTVFHASLKSRSPQEARTNNNKSNAATNNDQGTLRRTRKSRSPQEANIISCVEFSLIMALQDFDCAKCVNLTDNDVAGF